MFARSTTANAEPSAIDRGIAYVQNELMPTMMAMEGCVGLSMLVDRGTGRCITTSAWETQDAMWASADAVGPLRDHFMAIFDATAPIVNEWEVGLMRRDHSSTAGASARVTWLQGDPRSADASIDGFRTVLPSLEGLPGFCSASLLTDRDTGRSVSTVVFDNANDLAQTRDLDTRVAQQTGAEVLEVAEFELAVAQLRVPEMA